MTGLPTHSPLASPLQHPASQSHTPGLQQRYSQLKYTGCWNKTKEDREGVWQNWLKADCGGLYKH